MAVMTWKKGGMSFLMLLLHLSPCTGFSGVGSLSLKHSRLSASPRLPISPRRPISKYVLAPTCQFNGLTSDGKGGRRVKGVLKMEDAVTGSPVYIVGSMHYNPVSIRRASQTVEELASAGELAAVVIETCPTRWNATMSQPKWMRELLESEMGAAARLAEIQGVEVVLGDQNIEDTSNDIKQVLSETLQDLASPLSGGWARAAADVMAAGKKALTSKDRTGLGAADILDPLLIAAAPVTFIRYPAAWIIRSPVVAAGFVGFSFAVGAIPEVASALVQGASAAGGAADSDLTGEWAGYIVSLAFSAVELVVVSRLFVVALLNRRNVYIAKAIREACIKAKQAPRTPGGAERTAVVAVLGMAHVNGVQALLAEGQ